METLPIFKMRFRRIRKALGNLNIKTITRIKPSVYNAIDEDNIPAIKAKALSLLLRMFLF